MKNLNEELAQLKKALRENKEEIQEVFNVARELISDPEVQEFMQEYGALMSDLVSVMMKVPEFDKIYDQQADRIAEKIIERLSSAKDLEDLGIKENQHDEVQQAA